MWSFGTIFSQSNYDMLSGSLLGSMRLHINQAIMHASVWPNLFRFEMPSLNFSTYQQASGYDFFLNPTLALYETNKKFGINTPIMFNNSSTMTTWNTNGANTQIGTTNTGQINSNASNQPGGSIKSKQYDKLKAIAQVLINSGVLGSRAEELKEQINVGETLDEKVRNLKKALNEYSSEIRDMIKNPNCNLKIGGKSMPTLLRESGLAAAITQPSIDSALSKADLETTKEKKTEVLHNSLKDYDILEILGAYETINRSLIEDLKKVTDTDSKQAMIEYFAGRLIAKAETLLCRSELSEDTKTEITKTINDLRTNISSDIESNIDNITLNFNKLYSKTKLSATLLLDYDLQNNYGDVLDDIVTDNMFKLEAEKQLQADGYAINSATITLDSSKKERVEQFNNKHKINIAVTTDN